MFFVSMLLSQSLAANSPSPMTFPVFLKQGFSSILEFEEAPTQVVLGDQNLFQIEKLNRSIVIKPLTANAVTNMFVYFKTKETRLFILTASEDATPTYFKKFSSHVPKLPPTPNRKTIRLPQKILRGARLVKVAFDSKKDFLTVDLEVTADSSGVVTPSWDLIRLKYKDRTMAPSKLWSERREVQPDSRIKARFIFTKPNIPLDLKSVSVVIPIKGASIPMSIALGKVKI